MKGEIQNKFICPTDSLFLLRIMKKNFLLILLASFGLNPLLFSQDSDAFFNPYGKVYLMRSTGFEGSGLAYRTFIDGQIVCKLNNNKYSIHEVTAGEHYLSVQFYGKNSNKGAKKLLITVESGETYYFEVLHGNMDQYPYLEQLIENTAFIRMRRLKEDTKCQ